MTDSLGSVMLVIVQIALWILHYGHSDWGGIEWAALPWWLIWMPTLLCIVAAFIAFLVFLSVTKR